MTNESLNKLKECIAPFLNKSVEDINESTLIDKTALPGSIILHRMYASIKGIGFSVNDYSNIRTLGNLIAHLKDFPESNYTYSNEQIAKDEKKNEIIANTKKCIGIDIESINSLPKEEDFWESDFYLKTFSKKEIAYCLSSGNPLQSFLGKFSAKEAIMKADNDYLHTSLNQIEILNDEKGKPYFKDFNISISHIDDIVIAIAIRFPENKINSTPSMTNVLNEKKSEEINYIKMYKKIKIFLGISIVLWIALSVLILVHYLS